MELVFLKKILNERYFIYLPNLCFSFSSKNKDPINFVQNKKNMKLFALFWLVN